MYSSNLQFIFIWLFSFALAIGISKLVILSQYLLYKSPLAKVIVGTWEIKDLKLLQDWSEPIYFFQTLNRMERKIGFNRNGTGQLDNIFYFKWGINPSNNQVYLENIFEENGHSLDGNYTVNVDWFGKKENKEIVLFSDSNLLRAKGKNINQFQQLCCGIPCKSKAQIWIEKYLF